MHTHLHRCRSRIGGVGWGLLGNGLLPRPRILTNLSLPRSMRSYRDTTCVWVVAYDLSPSDIRIINCEFKIKMTRKEKEKREKEKKKEITKDCLPLISDMVIPKKCLDVRCKPYFLDI